MQQLISHYSIGEIILFIIILAFAIKELYTFLDWANKAIQEKVDKDRKPANIQQQLDEHIEEKEKEFAKLKENQNKIKEWMESLERKINLLIVSDRDDIKAWITAQHHHFTEKGSIDYYSLECISKRYEHYKEEGGNTFIDDLMEQINNLPKVGARIKG